MTHMAKIETKALRSAFVDAMSRVASTVHIVTTDGPGGRVGATVSAMTSVSADTPMPTLLVCLNRAGRLGRKIQDSGVFCVNVLSSDQSGLADVFAGRLGQSQAERFSSAEWVEMENGAPGLQGAVARPACRLCMTEGVGTHDVIFGAVEEIDLADGLSALIYADRSYRQATAI